MGSQSDLETVKETVDLLKKFKAVEVKKFPEGYKDKYINFAKGLGK